MLTFKGNLICARLLLWVGRQIKRFKWFLAAIVLNSEWEFWDLKSFWNIFYISPSSTILNFNWPCWFSDHNDHIPNEPEWKWFGVKYEWFCFITSILILNFYLYIASQESCIGIVKDLLESFVGKRFEANIFSSEMMEDPDKTKLLDPVWFSSFQIYRIWFNLTKNVKNFHFSFELWLELKIDRVNHVESYFV